MNAYLSGPLSLLRGYGYRSSASAEGRRNSRVQTDFERLMDRLNRRLYPETSPVLASYWLKTVYWSGYTREEWRELDRILRTQDQPAGSSEPLRQALADIRNWIKDSSRQ